jgi:hypothetical protein
MVVRQRSAGYVRVSVQLSYRWKWVYYVFRVATSLCRLLFESPKVNDALLFMTILSTDLRSLKRRGYNGKSNDNWSGHSADLPNFQSTES